jgi:hypothetical protein
MAFQAMTDFGASWRSQALDTPCYWIYRSMAKKSLTRFAEAYEALH